MNLIKDNYKKMAGLHALAIFFVIIDRYLKTFAQNSKPISTSWLGFNYSLNNNLAFSLPLANTVILILTSLIIIWLGLYYFKLLQKNSWQAGLIFALIIGALSNLTDRLLYGGVIDYFNFGPFNIINLSDILIVLSLAWCLWLEIFKRD